MNLGNCEEMVIVMMIDGGREIVEVRIIVLM